MLRRILQGILGVMVFLSMGEAALASGNHWQPFYEQAPVIEVIDPLISLVGSMPEGKAALVIKVTDVAVYTGHVCPGIAAGFMLTKKALALLYPDSTPVRGNVRVAGMAPNCLLDVASHITGARSFYGRGKINKGDLAVDEALKPASPGKLVLIFQRKDNGKMVKAVFNKFKLMSSEQQKEFGSYFKKMSAKDNQVSQKEQEEKRAEIQALVKKVLLTKPEGVFEISETEGYKFPETLKK
ncbi:formylmethanofuran dehydrogenase subunit E family protein [bacterium]|nr:formylmethanofuran dehydrogenase subunit E family protein [bacterium]